jgi:TolB-like protein
VTKYFFICLTALSLSLSAHAADSTAIAILDLKSTTIDSNLLVPLTSRLSSEIVKTGAYTVVERGEMEAILREQGFQQTGCTDASCAVQAGQLLNVQFIVTGTVDKLGAIYSINVRMVNVASGQVVKNISDDCVDCSIDDFVMKTVRRAALKLAGQDAADQADEKVSDALKTQRFLYKGKREGKMGSVVFTVTPLQSHVLFDDSAYGSGKILIENVPVKRHHFEVVPENRRYLTRYGTIRNGAGEIAEANIELRKAYFTGSIAFSGAFFNGSFTMPAGSWNVCINSYTDSLGASQPEVTIPLTEAISNSGTVPATMLTAMLGVETPRSYYGLVSHLPIANVFAYPDRREHDRDEFGPNHGSVTFQGDTLYYSTYVYRSFATFFSYMYKVFNARDIFTLSAGLNAGFGITHMVIDFYKFQNAAGHTFYNYYNYCNYTSSDDQVNEISTGNEFNNTSVNGTGPTEFDLVEREGARSYLKLDQMEFGGPVCMLRLGTPQDHARFFAQYMLGLGASEVESKNVEKRKFTVANRFSAGWIVRF